MKKTFWFIRLCAVLSGISLGVSCVTTYDAQGYPRQSVDPGVAIAGAAAAGILGYALASDGGGHHRSSHRVSYHQSYSHYGYYSPYDCYGGY